MPMNNRLLRPTTGLDPDAAKYSAAVEAADGEPLEPAVRTAIDALVKGCKADGIWDAIKASCLLCGPRTLSGALVPLVGTAPTSYAFASGDYNRVTGLKGDGATTYLDSGRANNADGQDDNHNAVYVTTAQLGALITSGVGGTGINYIDLNTITSARVINRGGAITVSGTIGSGLYASSRNDSAEYDYSTPQGSGTQSGSSVTPNALNVLLFVRSDGSTLSAFSHSRLAFYSIGSSLDLAALDTRISTYVAAIAAAL